MGGAGGQSLSAAEPIAFVGKVDIKSPLGNLQVNADDTFDDSLDDALFLPSASPSVPSPLARGDVDVVVEGSLIGKDDDESDSPLFVAPQTMTYSSDYDRSKLQSSSVMETHQQQQQQQSFSTHRGMPSHSSGASDESGSSANQSIQSTNGAAPSNSGVVASAEDKDDVVVADEEEEDKENWFPIGDLSVSADGAAMLVESMEVEGEQALTSVATTSECRH